MDAIVRRHTSRPPNLQRRGVGRLEPDAVRGRAGPAARCLVAARPLYPASRGAGAERTAPRRNFLDRNFLTRREIVKINVTEADILAINRHDPVRTPLDAAVARAMPGYEIEVGPVHVTARRYEPDGDGPPTLVEKYRCATPPKVRAFWYDWDDSSCTTPAPVSFELPDLPEWKRVV